MLLFELEADSLTPGHVEYLALGFDSIYDHVILLGSMVMLAFLKTIWTFVLFLEHFIGQRAVLVVVFWRTYRAQTTARTEAPSAKH